MESSQIQTLITMILYIGVVIGIGVYFAKRANENSENYYLGGRSLGPWVAAFSAEASDMSGWLLMGLPGLAYWTGLADAFWTAAGLAIGTYINWLIVAKRLRHYSEIAGNAITLPDFFSNRFHERKKVLMTISSLFGVDYHIMMIVGAVFVVVYTFLGGFLAESASDFMQAVIMVLALVIILTLGTVAAGGPGEVFSNLKAIPGYLGLFSQATPVLSETGEQIMQNGAPLFGDASPYSFINALSMLAWGLGYFGMPQVLLRFMAIRRKEELTKSRRIATVWVIISLFAAIMIGLIGRAYAPTAFATNSDAENIFSFLASILLHPLFAGLVSAGILAATISSSDSYLLIAASAFSKNLWQRLFRKEASDKEIMHVGRAALLIIAFLGAIIAMDENSVIFTIVSFAWAGFGATFGPLMLFSLFWKRTTRSGAIAGMISGGAMVFIWNFLIKPMGGIWGIYELLPAFIVSSAFIVIVSLLSKAPDKTIQDEFEAAKG